jgi:N-acetylneuraminic acid mutarotase
MRKKIFLTVSICFVLYISSHAQGSWTAKANLGPSATYGRSKAASFELNGFGYIGTGYNGTAKNDFWKYDPASNAWTQMSNFGGSARYGAVGFSVNGFGYIGTGYSSPSYVKDMWKYDPTGNSWSAIANFGGTGRMDATCFVIGPKAFVGTGYDGSVVKNDFWVYNPVSDAWTAKANFSGSACCCATGFSVSGKGYICLGRNATTTYYNTIYQYDTTANSWTPKTNFTGAAREGASAFVLGNNAYVGTGGSNSLGTLYNDFYRYDPAGNSWSPIASFIGTMRSNCCGFTIGNYGYVGMGYTGGQVNNFYQYNLCSVTNTVTTTPPSCNAGSNGSINLTVSGATNPVTYVWSNASTNQNLTGLTAGNYSVLVTDGNGCTSSNTMTLTAPAVLMGSITPTTPILCNGGNNGSANLIVTGGTSPYSYSWSNGASTQNATGLSAGSYSVIITDTNGCTASDSFTMNQPTAISLTVTSTPGSCTTCNNGTGTITGTGGTPAYTYLWNTAPVQITSTATGLMPGSYTACITDANGCTTCTVVTVGNSNGIVEYNSPGISVFPNPSNGEFRILGLRENAELSVFNCIGELVFKTEMPRKQEKVNVTSLPYGIYLLYIKTEDKILTKKIILTK